MLFIGTLKLYNPVYIYRNKSPPLPLGRNAQKEIKRDFAWALVLFFNFDWWVIIFVIQYWILVIKSDFFFNIYWNLWVLFYFTKNMEITHFKISLKISFLTVLLYVIHSWFSSILIIYHYVLQKINLVTIRYFLNHQIRELISNESFWHLRVICTHWANKKNRLRFVPYIINRIWLL